LRRRADRNAPPQEGRSTRAVASRTGFVPLIALAAPSEKRARREARAAGAFAG
jgi:hypothetical protein